MTDDSDIIKFPDIDPNIDYFRFIRTTRGLAKQLVAAKGNSRAIYILAVQNRLSLQAAGYISRCTLLSIEQARKQH